MYYYQPYPMYYPIRQSVMRAYAEIRGSKLAPNLKGYMTVMDIPNGTEVTVEVSGLPHYKPAQEGQSPIGPHGFHIHQTGDCSGGDSSEPFPNTGEHWNPTNQPHGNHAGDFPVLFSNDGYTRMSFFTNKFTAKDVVGKSIIIHENPDDYRTQPSGNSGKKIGCGVIKAY